jgi:polysaccharide pyruvyl transferase WcaK-like protein
MESIHGSSSGGRRVKVAIHGCYHNKNFGDVLIHDLIKAYVEREFDVQAVCPWLKYYDRGQVRTSGKGWYDVATADAGVFGGGGYFHGSGKAARRRVKRRYLLPAKIWKARKTRYAVIGVGAGPALSDDVAGPVRAICAGADRVVVRDDESRELLEKIGVAEGKTTATCDVVVSLTKKDIPDEAQRIAADDLRGAAKGGRLLGLHFPSFYGPRCFIGKPPFHARRPDPRLQSIFAEIASVMKKRDDFHPVWISTGHSNSYWYALRRMWRETLPEMKVLPYRNHWVTTALLGRLDGVITSMLHVGITAWTLGVPCCSLASHQKTPRFYRQIGRSRYCREAGSSVSSIRDWVEEFAKDPVAFAAEDDEARVRLPRLAHRNFEILGEWLNDVGARRIVGCQASRVSPDEDTTTR